MSDVVVTVPKREWKHWLAEGCLPGERAPAHTSYLFSVGGCPRIDRGERVYVVSHGRLRGYAPLVELDHEIAGGRLRFFLVRGGGAVAVTIDEPISGFRGFRYRWWEREAERWFPNWKTEGIS